MLSSGGASQPAVNPAVNLTVGTFNVGSADGEEQTRALSRGGRRDAIVQELPWLVQVWRAVRIQARDGGRHGGV